MAKKQDIFNIVGVLVVLIAVAAVMVLVSKRSGTSPQSSSTTKQITAPQPTVEPVVPAVVPPGLPSDLPLEKTAQVQQNFEYKDPVTGKTQSTRVYVSKKTIDENFTIFKTYLSSNGWTVNQTIDQPTVKKLSSTKDSARLDIDINKNSQGQVTVNVSYLN